METGELQRSGLIKMPEKDYETLCKARDQISQATALKKEAELACLRQDESKILKRIASKEQENASNFIARVLAA